MRPIIGIAALAALSACAADLTRKSDEYGTRFEMISTEYGTFRVYEHPTKNTLAVSSTLGAAAGDGIVRGLTFGVGTVLPSEGVYQEVAEAYLAKHSALASCRIANGYLLQRPIYEFTYECPVDDTDAPLKTTAA